MWEKLFVKWHPLVGWVSVFDWSFKAVVVLCPYLIGWDFYSWLGVAHKCERKFGLVWPVCYVWRGLGISRISHVVTQWLILEQESELQSHIYICDVSSTLSDTWQRTIWRWWGKLTDQMIDINSDNKIMTQDCCKALVPSPVFLDPIQS